LSCFRYIIRTFRQPVFIAAVVLLAFASAANAAGWQARTDNDADATILLPGQELTIELPAGSSRYALLGLDGFEHLGFLERMFKSVYLGKVAQFLIAQGAVIGVHHLGTGKYDLKFVYPEDPRVGLVLSDVAYPDQHINVVRILPDATAMFKRGPITFGQRASPNLSMTVDSSPTKRHEFVYESAKGANQSQPGLVRMFEPGIFNIRPPSFDEHQLWIGQCLQPASLREPAQVKYTHVGSAESGPIVITDRNPLHTLHSLHQQVVRPLTR